MIDSWFDSVLGSLGNEGPDPASATQILLLLLLALALSQCIAWIYVATHSGVSFSRSQAQSLVLLSVIVALVMLAIGNHLARAFGLFGALALVRFRTPVKDMRDTAFLFMAVGIGISVGSQNIKVAVVGTLVLSVLVPYLSWTRFGSRTSHDGLLRFSLLSMPEVEMAARAVMGRHCRRVTLTQATDAGATRDFAYRVRLGDTGRSEAFVTELRAVEGLSGVSLFVHDDNEEV